MEAAAQIDLVTGRILGTIVATGPSIVYSSTVISIDYTTYSSYILDDTLKDNYYFVSGTITARASHSIALDSTTLTADGVDTVTFSSIPSGAIATIEVPIGSGAASIPPITITDGSLVFTTKVAGSYLCTIELFPTKAKIATLVAT